MASVKLDKFNRSIELINTKLNDMESAIHSFKSEVYSCIRDTKESILSEIKNISCEVYDIANMVCDLEKRLDQLEYEQRSCDMTVTRVTSNNKKSPFDLMKLICEKINFPGDIEQCNIFRIRVQNNNRHNRIHPIIVQFPNRRLKSMFFSCYMSFGQLKLSDIGFNATTRIFCNDGLTKKNSKLLSSAKVLVKSGLISKVFAKRGRIFVVDLLSKEPKLIASESDLRCFKSSASSNHTHNMTQQASRSQENKHLQPSLQLNLASSYMAPEMTKQPTATTSSSSSSSTSSSFASKSDSLINSVIDDMSNNTPLQRVLRSQTNSTSSTPEYEAAQQQAETLK